MVSTAKKRCPMTYFCATIHDTFILALEVSFSVPLWGFAPPHRWQLPVHVSANMNWCFSREKSTRSNHHPRPYCLTWDKETCDLLHNLPIQFVSHWLCSDETSDVDTTHWSPWIEGRWTFGSVFGRTFSGSERKSDLRLPFFMMMSTVLPFLYAAGCFEQSQLPQNAYMRMEGLATSFPEFLYNTIICFSFLTAYIHSFLVLVCTCGETCRLSCTISPVFSLWRSPHTARSININFRFSFSGGETSILEVLLIFRLIFLY
jgi:hypothetical protein